MKKRRLKKINTKLTAEIADLKSKLWEAEATAFVNGSRLAGAEERNRRLTAQNRNMNVSLTVERGNNANLRRDNERLQKLVPEDAVLAAIWDEQNGARPPQD